jgi:gamma-glutamyl-gamma-aminobutyrate hydrolase PuuD
MKVFVVGGDVYYASWIKDHEFVPTLAQADIVFFTGGEDVSPNLYNCEKHYTTYCNPHRDAYEVEMFRNVNPDQLVIGVCRGSQFCCVMNGGKLVQNCNHHALAGVHNIINVDNEIYKITSTHHQMQYPFDLDPKDYDILYWAQKLATKYEGDGIDATKIVKEPEIVLYHKENKPKCLAIQGHPEMMPHTVLHDMLNDLILQCFRLTYMVFM